MLPHRNIKKLDRYLFIAAIVLLSGFTAVRLAVKITEKTQKVTLTFTQFLERGLEDGALASLIAEFEERNPGIRIRAETRPYGEQYQGGAGEAPKQGEQPAGIVILDEGWVNAFLQRDLLASLNPYVQSGPDSDQRVIPLISFMDLLFYNIDLLKAAGFDRPPKNRAEFLACAKAFARGKGTAPSEPAASSPGTGIFGAALALSPEDRRGIRRDVFSWFRAAGAPVIRDGRPDFQNRALVETLDFLGQLNREGLLSPGTFTKTGAQKNGEFARGRVAMMIGSMEDIPFLREQMGDPAFGVTLIPAPAGYTGKPVIGPSFWYAGISSSCKHPGEAWAFLAFLAEKSPLLAAQTRAVPGSGDSPGSYIKEDPLYSKAWDIYEAAEVIRDFSPGFPRTEDLETIIREELAALFAGQKNAAETSAAIQARWESGG
ncbi:MAG: extracellular solute-binding protein, partial [Treponema sp.]|nr:extracellular solute-binding protein [Treponema sp.]